MKVQSIASWLVLPIFRQAFEQVSNAKEIVERSGIDIRSLKDPSSRLPVTKVITCMDEFANSLGKADIGITWATDTDDQYSVLHHLFLSSETLGDALQYWQKYHILQSDLPSPQFEVDHLGKLHIRFGYLCDSIRLNELVVSVILDWCEQLSGNDFAPEVIDLAWDEPSYSYSCRRVWKSAIRFNQKHTEIVIGSGWLDKQLQQTNPHVMNMIQNEVNNLAVKLSNRGSLSERIRNAIEQDRIQFNATQNEVADLFHISSRTLNRHLQHEGTSLKTILTELRIQSAKRLLEEGDYNIEQIAMKVGFSGRRTLDRIFIKHVGMSPAQYRVKASKERAFEGTPGFESELG